MRVKIRARANAEHDRTLRAPVFETSYHWYKYNIISELLDLLKKNIEYQALNFCCDTYSIHHKTNHG